MLAPKNFLTQKFFTQKFLDAKIFGFTACYRPLHRLEQFKTARINSVKLQVFLNPKTLGYRNRKPKLDIVDPS